VSDPEPADPERPALSITEAAKAAGVDRRTIRRRLDADAFPNAYRDPTEGSWRLPVADLLAAGITLHAPTPPDAQAENEPAPPPDELAELRAAVTEWRRRAEVAEALANERAERVADLRTALLALGAGPTDDTRPTTVTPSPARRRWPRRK
jgi:hypothetical protein